MRARGRGSLPQISRPRHLLQCVEPRLSFEHLPACLSVSCVLTCSVSVAIRSYFDELGIEASGHQLRHWFGTGIYAVTHDIRLTQELLGHQSPDTTAIYVAWAAVDAAPAVAALKISGRA